ncbi:hypothetical protein [Anatilimnocola floriformis]|uniref:hypothetical protein n=1 Tax=Anatilimnocola floriformis TaxID=2948575 RepID=UPI0020C33EE4|nr:hypothetical protein [Anatilimnocola floriformis]
MTRESRAPLIVAIVLLLLPVLYVGSYLVLVQPGEDRLERVSMDRIAFRNYRMNGDWPSRIFWPLEQIDRKLRPGVWASPAFESRSGASPKIPVSP